MALGFVVGLSLGLLGGGGSILTVPIFVYIVGFDAKAAIAMSLAVVGATSLAGAIGHWRIGNVHVRVAFVFGTVAMLGTFAGARLAVFFSGAAQLVLFAVVMISAAFFMLRGSVPGLGKGVVAPHSRDDPRLLVGLLALEGIAVGILTGLVGVGGGFLIVPALVLLAGISMKQAVGTSLLIIALKSTAGFLGYLGQVQIHWTFMGFFTLVAMTGIVTGTYLVRFVPQRALRQVFAIFLLVVGAAILFQNRAVFVANREAPETSSTASRVFDPFGSRVGRGLAEPGSPQLDRGVLDSPKAVG
jgi:uncharacterized membrane protein YfcA